MTLRRARLCFCSTAPSQGTEVWIEGVLAVDTRACDTVVPRSIGPGIPVQLSLQSVRGMAYEMADGDELPDLGEKRRLCVDRESIRGPAYQHACRGRPQGPAESQQVYGYGL